jgi:methyl-accepting chemotaxis protein
MVFEIALGACSILLLSSLYVNWNLMKKTELLESWMEETSKMVQTTYDELQKIDSTGHFEADDEIGSIFDGIKLTIENLNDYIKGS